MQELRYTLLADGSSDRALLPILTWLLRQSCGAIPIEAEFADLRRLPHPPKKLSERIHWSVELYPCDLLFVHRDAESASIEEREAEIRKALEESSVEDSVRVVCVVPVRMQEAWLLIDEAALRRAAGNPNGTQPLAMPDVKKLERLADPKQLICDLLRQASGLRGRRLKSFSWRSSAHRVAGIIDDFSPLYGLAAFKRLAAEVERVVTTAE
ncbi:MAG: hypothetical protein OXH81_19955 [Gemmatimonadetes bacterium]|nr:hypothetical protein [Gemmatimonadota bacterium]MDE2733545.1 hypothetical protein [Gemmatimonadota bacterium]